MPTINPDKVCYIIIKAREFDEKVEPDDPDSGSNPTDDKSVSILEDNADDPTLLELQTVIRDLNVDEQAELVALAWIGRGDYEAGEWNEAVAEARANHTARTAEYLTGTPMLGDLLEEGLAAFDLSCEDVEKGRL
jgi:hypothetical protein